jgi:hypothetical protein
MGFLDLFIERTDEPKKESNSVTPAVPKINTVPPVAGTTVSNISVPTYSAPVASEDMAKFNQHFDELFDKANLPGPDYFEFSKMCQAMATLADSAKYPAIFTGLQVQGLSKEKLVESANHYVAIIDEDAKKFNSAIDAKILAEVQAKRNDAVNKQKALQEKINLIAQLQAEISKDTSEIEALQNDANDQERKAQEKATTYKTACEARKAAILEDVSKINAFIK